MRPWTGEVGAGFSVAGRGLAVGLLLALAACATAPPPAQGPAASPSPPAEAAPGQPPPPRAPAPPPVLENRTFALVDGIPQYRIGPGDLLEILLARGVTQDRLSLTVRADGRVPVLFLEVAIGGLTPEQAAREMERALAIYYRAPRVEVLVKEFNSKKVTVLGAVSGAGGRGSGIYPLRGRTSLTEFLASIGGGGGGGGLGAGRGARGGGRGGAEGVRLRRGREARDGSVPDRHDSGGGDRRGGGDHPGGRCGRDPDHPREPPRWAHRPRRPRGGPGPPRRSPA